MEVSLCMIVKNEELVLARCLDSIKQFVDEIIIVDTGSSDSTKDIAKLYTGNIYDFVWVDDFSKARNYAFSKATKEYVMWLDADDVIDSDQINQFLEFKSMDKEFDTAMIKYQMDFDSTDVPHLSFYRERIFKKENNPTFIDPVHEYCESKGKVIYLDFAISHRKVKSIDSKRNLKIYTQMIENGISFSPRQKYYYARELYYNSLYQECISTMNDFLLSNMGWKEDNIGACLILSSCYERLEQFNMSLEMLFKSFIYDLPRPEVCCEIGKLYVAKNEYRRAIYYYQLAISSNTTSVSGFKNPYSSTIIPLLQLCLCYFKTNDLEKSVFYNEEAGKINPKHPSYLYNINYFSSLKKTKQDAN